jgi:PAS domain S-box-containing protein
MHPSLLAHIQDMVTVLSADGRFTWQSPSTERVLGYAPGELAGRSALELVHPEDRAEAAALLERTVAAPDAVGVLTYRVRHRDGSWREMEATGKNLLHDPRVGGVVLSARDVSERAAAARALAAANRAKSEFLSRISHELRTPLNAILGFAQLLEMELVGEAERESVAQISRAGRHLLQLIDEVLEIARIEEGRLALSIEPVSAGEAVRQALELVAPQARAAGVSLHAAHAHDAMHLLADLQRVRQVLINLASNAVKYGRRGGRAEIAVRRAAGRDGARVRIEVRDDGIGIPADRIPLLFTPFERLGAERLGIEGMGLGLALSRRLVERMGGEMGCESREGEGSTFWLELPAAGPVEHATPAGEPRLPREPPRRPRLRGTVLLVEDNPMNARLLERALAGHPELRLLHAPSGQLALDVAALHHPDLVLLDLHLPDLHGREVLARLRADPRTADTPVLVVTADVHARRCEALAALGPRAVITKPFDLAALLEEMERALPGCSGGYR